MTPAPLTAIAAIEKAMEGATPGPWSFQYTDESGECFIISENLGGLVGAALPWPTEIDDRDFRRVISNARYIAACSPDRMREVLAAARKAEALERENAQLREALEPFAEIADLVDSETEGVADNDEFQMHFHDYLMASWKLSLFRRARTLIKDSADANG